jgi:hypothetical protein
VRRLGRWLSSAASAVYAMLLWLGWRDHDDEETPDG